jgi:hypothetical protein
MLSINFSETPSPASTETTISSDPIPTASAASQASTIAFSPSLASLSGSTQDILIGKVHRLLLKHKGFSQRYTDWQSASLSFEEQDPDGVIARRLCIFYFIELRHLQATQHIKQQAYVSQLEDLESQLANLHQAHTHINNLDDFQLPGYLDELSQLHQAVEKAERTSLLARAQHLRSITCKLCEQAITIANTLQQLRCYMPQKHHQSVPQRYSTLSPPGLHQQAAPNFYHYQQPAAGGGGGGGGGSLSYRDSLVIDDSRSSSRSVSPVAIPSSRSSSPSPDIPPPPPLTIPSSSPSPEAYPTSPSHHHTYTLSGTFSLTLTPNQMTTSDTVLLSPDEDPCAYTCHFGDPRTDYQMCLTDVPDDEGDLSRDLYALQTYHSDAEDSKEDGAEGSGHMDCSSTNSDSASVSSHATSSNSSAPLDGSQEEHRQWIADGCPDSD